MQGLNELFAQGNLYAHDLITDCKLLKIIRYRYEWHEFKYKNKFPQKNCRLLFAIAAKTYLFYYKLLYALTTLKLNDFDKLPSSLLSG